MPSLLYKLPFTYYPSSISLLLTADSAAKISRLRLSKEEKELRKRAAQIKLGLDRDYHRL
jgi:hypothetical protein